MSRLEDFDIFDQGSAKINNEYASRKSKVAKSRKSLKRPPTPDRSPDGTSRYGRPHKPKFECDDFLPTEAVLGKSPKSPKKKEKKIIKRNILSVKPEPLFDDIASDVAYIRDCSSLLFNNSVNAHPESPLKEEEEKLLNDSVEDPLTDEVVTEFEPGDLIWGRVGHHPFWPCIIINDPEFNVFHKTAGRGRLMYHVLFYGDNGKRSWVASSVVLRFLGLQEFQSQVSSITLEMKKKDTKWFSGFFVKPNQQQKWFAAVQEAESAMPMTRDERVDAFLRNFPDKHSKSIKKSKDEETQDSEAEDDEVVKDVTPNRASKLSTPKQKKYNLPKGDTPLPEKRKRGRPRKNESGTPHESQSKESANESTPTQTPNRVLKSKVHAENSVNSHSATVESLSGEERDEEPEILIEDLIMEDKKAAEIALKSFRAWVIPHMSEHYSHASKDAIEAMVLQEWNSTNNFDRAEWVPADLSDPIRARFETQREEERVTKQDSNTSDEEGKYDDGAGVEDEIVTVASTKAGKAPAVASLSKKEVNLFRGYRIEKVCQVCEKPGNTVKCRGPCSGTFHVECARGADNVEAPVQFIKDEDDKPRKRERKKKIDPAVAVLKQETQKAKLEARKKKIYAEEETDSDLEYNDGDIIDMNNPDIAMMMIMGDISMTPKVSMLLDEESEEEEEDINNVTNDNLHPTSDGKVFIGDFRCGDCAVLRTPLCFSCGQATDPSGQDSTRHRCSTGHCGKHFHEQCLKMWPQASYGFRKGVLHNLTCPQHVCHTCVSDNPRESIGRFSHEKLVRCIRCPTSYHNGNHCVPAGSEILTASQMICPRHYEPPKKGNHHVNASWCFICSMGGSLICCDLCPSSIHVECLKIKPPKGSYICEDCETGRFPLYNEVLWVKLWTYRWWPALTLFPSEVPDNVKNLPHTLGEFAVKFLGTNDHYWTHRGRCFVFHEGDSVQDGKKISKSSMDSAFLQGVKEANELHKAHKEFRAKLQLQAKSSSMKPPQYTKIKTNKPIGKVKMFELDASNISPCECDPNSEHPCSPDSDCLNRILLQECDPNTCPAGERCENRCFEKRLYPALEPSRTEGRGWGLKTLVDIKKGSFVIEYVGEVIDDEEYQRRLQRKHNEKDENYYFLTIDSFRIIDAGPKGNVSRFMNHSCQPNCETQKWTVAGDTRVGLFALHDIPANSELTFNYNLESKGNEKKPCMCGAAECSGFIGAKKKVSQPEVKAATSSGKKKRRKPRIRNLIEDICLTCNLGTEKGDLITCINKDCASRYHLSCAGLTSIPPGKWLCRRHRCNLCEKRAPHWCSYCTDSYCPLHIGDLLVNDPLHGYICEVHQKNPTSVDDHKKKREEERKQKEEEKRKRDEEERAQRRSRRERIVSDEEVTKKKPKRSSDKEDVSETSSEDPNEDKHAGSSAVYFESQVFEEVKQKEGGKDEDTSRKEGKNTPSKAIKRRKSSHKYKINGNSNFGDDVLKLSSKKAKVPQSKSDVSSSNDAHSPSKSKSKHKSPRKENRFAEVEHFDTIDVGGTVSHETEYLNTQSSDSEKDEIPGADPSLDKFLLKVHDPIDDKDTKTCENIADKAFQRALDNTYIPLSPSVPNKKRRKHASPPNQDYGKLYKKSRREMDKEMKGELSNELQDIALTFASDGQDSPKLETKRARGHGQTRGRRSLGVVRTRPADSTSKTAFELPLLGAINNTIHHLPPFSSPAPLKSPVHPKERANSVTPEKVSTPAVLFAMQRAKGSKVLPPNRRLSSAREIAFNRQFNSEFSDKIETAGKGVKVLKGCLPSLDSSTTSNRTENVHSETVQGGVLKRARPVLSRVEDNGVSLEEDANEKIMDSNIIPTPKQSLPNTIVSPPIKKKTPSSNKKKSTNLGVCPLWNQDIMDIMQTN